MSTSGSRRSPLLFLVFAALSFAVAIGWTLTIHNADSLIPVFVSLDHWLPFYWGQDRFGMLLPLIAMPVRDSFWNLIAQNALGVFLLLSGAYLAAERCTVRQPAIVALGLLSLLLAWPAPTTALQLLTTNQSYSPALGLYALAFGLLPGDSSWPRRAGVAFLMALGAWTNAGTGLLMLTALAVAAVMPRLRADAIWLLAGVVLSLTGHVVLQKLAPGVRLDTSHVTVAALAEVKALTAGFWSDAYRHLLGPAVWLTVPAGVFALYLERRDDTARQAVIAVVVGCGLYGFAMIALFAGTGRHLTPALPLLLGTLLVVFARHLPAAAGLPAAVALAGVVLLQSGADWPEASRRRLVTRLTDGHAIELYQADVSVVTGDYWQAWPYAFALNMLHEGVSGTRPVVPVALRSEDFYLQRAQQIGEGSRIVVVPPAEYFYWNLRGPKVELSVVRSKQAYDIAVVRAVTN